MRLASLQHSTSENTHNIIKIKAYTVSYVSSERFDVPISANILFSLVSESECSNAECAHQPAPSVAAAILRETGVGQRFVAAHSRGLSEKIKTTK